MSDVAPNKYLTLPTMALVVAPFGSGKTSLLQYLVLENAEQIAGIVLFSNTGRDSWESNYSWLNPLYIYDEWDPSILDKIKQLGKRIKKHFPNKHLLLIFDDSIAMAKSMFEGKEFKTLLTTLRWYNTSILVSLHQLQKEVSTLMRNNVREVFFFQQSEPNGLKIIAETWGTPSNNLRDPKELQATIGGLQKYHFLHYSTSSHEWDIGKVPYPLPDFRIVLHPDDKKVVGKTLVYGNDDRVNLKMVERPPESIIEVDEDDDSDLYQEPEIEEVTEEDDPVIHQLTKDLRQPAQPTKKKRQMDEKKGSDDETEPSPKKPAKNASKKPSFDKSLIELVDEIDGKTDKEKLTPVQEVAKHRILATFNYIAAHPGNPDLELFEQVSPGFFAQDFNSMTIKELTDAFRKYHGTRSTYGLIDGISKRYDLVQQVADFYTPKIAGQFSKEAFQASRNFIEPHKHESILASIQRSHPHGMPGDGGDAISLIERLVGLGINTYMLRSAAMEAKPDHKNKLAAELTESEVAGYLEGLIPPSVVPVLEIDNKLNI